MPCRQNLQSKSKQIETNTGSFCKHSQGLPVFCMESVLSLEQAKKVAATKTPRTSSRKFWMQRASRLPCRQNLQSKSKQIETNTGSFCKHSQGLPVFCMESVPSLEQAKKVVVTKECVTEGKQPEILDAEGKPIAVQAESAK